MTANYTFNPASEATGINHYPGSGEAISWACEETVKECEEGKGTKWTRNIPGIDGSLAAIQVGTGTPVLQLHDLAGNVIATAADSETETKLLTTYNPTEFGVPVNGTPPTKYSWLGASGYTPEQSSGAANPGGGTYVPQLGKPLQTQSTIPPGAFPSGSYTEGPYVTTLESWVGQSNGNWGAGGTGREATRQAEAKKHQEEEARARANQPPGMVPTPGEGGTEEPANYCLLAIITEQEDEGCGDGGGGGYECSGGNACAAAPCSNGDNPHSGHCGAQLPGRELCSNPLQQGCRVSTGRLPSGTRLGSLKIINSPEGPLAGCIVGGVVGGTFAVYSTAGLAVQAGATGGCFVGGGLVIIAEHIF